MFLASENPVKVQAVEQSFKNMFPEDYTESIIFEGRSTKSGVSGSFFACFCSVHAADYCSV